MSQSLRLHELSVFPLAIPMRLTFEHAAARRTTADPIVIRISAADLADAGFGETLARPYVTGESVQTVLADVERVLAPRLRGFSPSSFAEAIAFCDTLPLEHEGRSIAAARAAVELALLDLAGKAFAHPCAAAALECNLPGFTPPGCLDTVRYSGIVIGRGPTKLRWLLRVQRAYGLRDFKIKVAMPGWEERLEAAYGELKGDIARQRVTLRADANGGWSFDQAAAALSLLERCGVCALEQPLAKPDDGNLSALAQKTRIDLIADESLGTLADAKRLIASGVKVLNVRIAKNGGLLPSWRIASTALAAGCDVQLGCLVGETSILTAAGIAFLEACPRVRFVEGAFGAWLLKGDVTRRAIRFGSGGRVRRPPRGPGLGITVLEDRLGSLASTTPLRIPL